MTILPQEEERLKVGISALFIMRVPQTLLAVVCQLLMRHSRRQGLQFTVIALIFVFLIVVIESSGVIQFDPKEHSTDTKKVFPFLLCLDIEKRWIWKLLNARDSRMITFQRVGYLRERMQL